MNNFYFFNADILIDNEQTPLDVLSENIPIRHICPICESDIVVSGRCKTCYNCGWSTCDI